MATLILVRHGHVEGIHPERFRGRRDIPLTVQGRRQARATAQYIAARWHPKMVYTSPLQRCVQTGREIATACGSDFVQLEDLNDLDYGTWQWCTHEEARAKSPQLLDRWLTAPHLVRFPKGESLQDVIARVSNVIRMVLEHHSTEAVVAVGHDSGIRAMLLQLLEQPISAYWRLAHHPAAVSEVDVRSHGARVIRINETHHLDEPFSLKRGSTHER
ncbi:MAG TPA: histidine phosphatase family protein [Steroidobacteraceae bacterium]|nr:histidine phosphatase family protein [Steroidobacteraceae bacterium]